MSYVLVFLTLAIQGVLLFCVYNQVVLKNTSWHKGIVNTGQDWNLIAPSQSGCNDGGSLCSMENGIYTCAPPSLQLIGRWDELDTNKDGTWTREEVTAARESLQCKYAVDPMEVFDMLIALLKQRSEFIWLHPDVKKGAAVNKHYFTYIMGDVTMCGYRNSDMCGNLIKKGIFDVPLNNVSIPRVGTTIKSALDYCQELLGKRGLCERNLPSTYATWKIESVQECEEPTYQKFVYTDLTDGHVKSLLAVDYKARERYEIAQTPIFMMYKTCIILIWMLLIISQLREVWKTFAWVIELPNSKEDATTSSPSELLNSPHDSALRTVDALEGMTWRHRAALGLVTILRILMLCVLMYVGLHFLGRQTDYIGLLLDGVALVFIVEVAHILYARILRQEVRTHWEEREPIEIVKRGHKALTSRPDITDFLWFALVFSLAVAFLVWYTTSIVSPVYDALQCTCLSEGASCRESHAFSKSFWDQYWREGVPSAISGIKDMKASFYSAPFNSPAPAPAAARAARAAVNLLKHVHHHPRLG